MESSAAPLILLEQVSKQYGDKWAVRDLSLAIGPGELFAFLGPNGAGKTTTIKLIAGLLRPAAGNVWVAGHRMSTDALAPRRLLSYVPDQPYLYEKLTGRDFLEFVREIHGLGSEARAREEELVEILEIGSFAPDLIETYSHGMRQRLAFAAALVPQPRVLVVDEPMVGLDPRSTRIVKDLLRSHATKGNAVLMSTHTLAIAEEVADRIGIIHQGRLIRLGTLADLRRESNGKRSLEEFFLEVTAQAVEGA